MKHFHSLAVRLSVRFMLILLVAVVFISLVFLFVLRFYIKSERQGELIKCAQIIESSYNALKLSDFVSVPYYISYCVFDEKNSDVISSNDPFLPLLNDTGGRAKTYWKKGYYVDGDLNILYFAKKLNDSSVIIMTSIDIDNDSYSKMLKFVPVTIGFAFLPLVLICFLISIFFTKQTLAPVVKMTEEARQISGTSFDKMLSVSSNDDELDRLAMTFNELFGRMKVDFDRERNFTSDVSHELKTPVSVILGQANLIRRWGKDDRVQLEKSIDMIIREGKSMNVIISNLLQISRLENGKIVPKRELIIMKELFERLKDETSIIDERVKLIGDFNEDFSFWCDNELVHQLFMIAISNSIKFCNCDCVITVKAQRICDKTVIEISDNGNGFCDDVLPFVFDRFYRGDSAHERSAGGAGLGLSIAKAIVMSLNGTVKAFNVPSGHGAVIKFEL